VGVSLLTCLWLQVTVEPSGLVTWSHPRRNAVFVRHAQALEDGHEVVVRIARA